MKDEVHIYIVLRAAISPPSLPDSLLFFVHHVVCNAGMQMNWLVLEECDCTLCFWYAGSYNENKSFQRPDSFFVLAVCVCVCSCDFIALFILIIPFWLKYKNVFQFSSKQSLQKYHAYRWFCSVKSANRVMPPVRDHGPHNRSATGKLAKLFFW